MASYIVSRKTTGIRLQAPSTALIIMLEQDLLLTSKQIQHVMSK